MRIRLQKIMRIRIRHTVHNCTEKLAPLLHKHSKTPKPLPSVGGCVILSEKAMHRNKSHYGTMRRSATIMCIPVYVCKLKRGFSGTILFCLRYLTLLHLPPLRFQCVEDAGIECRTVATLALTGRRSNHSARSQKRLKVNHISVITNSYHFLLRIHVKENRSILFLNPNRCTVHFIYFVKESSFPSRFLIPS
jgi:hypothetical protein